MDQEISVYIFPSAESRGVSMTSTVKEAEKQSLTPLFYLHRWIACVYAKSLQSCLTLCDPMDSSLTGSSVHGILWQEYWSGLSCPPPGDLPHPGTEPTSLIAPALAGGFFTTSAAREVPYVNQVQWNLLGLTWEGLSFPSGSDRKASAYNAGDPGSIPGSGKSPEVNSNPLQYSCLENPMDGGAW